MQTDRKERVTGYVVIAVALLMVIQGVWLSVKQSKESECQAQYNSDITAVQKQRATWADEDRKALNDMIFTVIDAKANQATRTQAVQDYAATARRNDANRQANPFPTRTSCRYGWL
jgi:septal ring factor EnvC (AmiA/AmiB activator)